MKQMLDQLSELTEIKVLVQALSAKLDTVLQQQGASDEHDPGDAVPPGVAVQAAAPLSAEDQAVLEKLEEEPKAADPESQQAD